MTCRQREKLMVRTLDGVLAAPDRDELEAHLERCPRCRRTMEEYRGLFQALAPSAVPRPRAYSWERLKALIGEREEAGLRPEFRTWALKVIPAAVALALLIGGASFLFSPSSSSNYTPSEEVLLRNTNPLVEARTILEQKRLEDKNMMLIFASNEGGLSERR
jgi:anti-sigma factor RsiW